MINKIIMVEKKILLEAAKDLKKWGVKNPCYIGVVGFDGSDGKEYTLEDFTEEEWNVIKEEINKGKTKYMICHQIKYNEGFGRNETIYTLKKVS